MEKKIYTLQNFLTPNGPGFRHSISWVERYPIMKSWDYPSLSFTSRVGTSIAEGIGVRQVFFECVRPDPLGQALREAEIPEAEIFGQKIYRILDSSAAPSGGRSL